MSGLPSPEETNFLANFWKEVIGGTIIILLGWYAKVQGKNNEIYMEKSDIEQSMKMCKQDILIEFMKMLDERDDKLIIRVKEIIGK